VTARWEGLSGGQGAWPDRPAGVFPAQPPVQPLTPGLTGVGARLRRARQDRGITLDAAERDTHIARHHLEALEEEHFDSFSAPVYLRGFLRSYSQYLGLDSGELLALLPADRPAEEERLQPLSRLGRPRGHHEAERERRDPLARGAAPLTYGSTHSGGDEAPLGQPMAPRRGAGQREPSLRVVPSMDPLGRLGWPERPGDPPPTRGAPEYDEMAEQAGRVHAAEYARRPGRDRIARETLREQPLSARRPRHWAVSSRWRGLIPDDVRPFFQQEVLTVVAGAVAGLFLLLALVLAFGGGDVSPTIVIAATTGAAATETIPAPSGAPSAHGSMPNVQGADVSSALGALRVTGVVPVVIGASGTNLSNQRIVSQAPSAGTPIDSQTPVLLVAGTGG
jgi:hypothetical protein